MFILPTRGRPEGLKRFVEACERTRAWGWPCRVRVDADDPALPGYHALALPPWFTLRVGPRISNAPSLNEQFAAEPSWSFYGVLADDVVPETVGWDRALIVAAGRDGVAFANDGIQGSKIATHPVLGGDFVRSLGFIALPGLKRLYADNVWTEIAKDRGVLRYVPDVSVRHLHFSNGAPMDETYKKPEGDADRAIYERWQATREVAHV